MSKSFVVVVGGVEGKGWEVDRVGAGAGVWGGQRHLGPVGTERVIVGIPAFLHDWCQINTALSYSARGLFYL